MEPLIQQQDPSFVQIWDTQPQVRAGRSRRPNMRSLTQRRELQCPMTTGNSTESSGEASWWNWLLPNWSLIDYLRGNAVPVENGPRVFTTEQEQQLLASSIDRNSSLIEQMWDYFHGLFSEKKTKTNLWIIRPLSKFNWFNSLPDPDELMANIRLNRQNRRLQRSMGYNGSCIDPSWKTKGYDDYDCSSNRGEDENCGFGIIPPRFLKNVDYKCSDHIILRARPILMDRPIIFTEWTSIEYRFRQGREIFQVLEGNIENLYPVVDGPSMDPTRFISILPNLLNNSTGSFWWNGFCLDLSDTPEDRIRVTNIRSAGTNAGIEFSIHGLGEILVSQMEKQLEIMATDPISHNIKTITITGEKATTNLKFWCEDEDYLVINIPSSYVPLY